MVFGSFTKNPQSGVRRQGHIRTGRHPGNRVSSFISLFLAHLLIHDPVDKAPT